MDKARFIESQRRPQAQAKKLIDAANLTSTREPESQRATKRKRASTMLALS